MVLNLIAKMIAFITRRGRGVFKFLFVIDDFFRLFAMTILIPLFFSWIGFSKIIVNLGFVLGAVIDIHDFVSDASFAKFGKR